jgi:hypothetical protein
VPEGSNVERSRAFARAEVQRLLGLDEPDAGALFELAADELGAQRAARCLRLVRRVPLTQRGDATAHVAALVVGTRELAEAWWERTGDALLAGADEGTLAAVAHRLSDACADERWGAPIDDVDLDDPRGDDRVALPAGAQAGDSYVASFDPGCRVVVGVVEREGGVLGSELGDLRYDETEDVRWAWAMASDSGPIRLPGEVAGTDSDPFAAPLAPKVALRLRAWAGEHEADGAMLGDAWRTRGDLWEARFRLGLPYGRPGEWWPFEIVTRAAVDGDDEQLGYALARLDMF